MIRANLISNYFGQAVIALLNIAFVPIYIRYLGIENYGIIGLFTLLTACLSVFEVSISNALMREMARRYEISATEVRRSIKDLLRTVELASVVIAVILGFGIILSSNWMASYWLKTNNLSGTALKNAIICMGVLIALRFMEGIYRSAIIGMQKQVVLNYISIILAAIRSLGGVLVLSWNSGSVLPFLVWQGVASIIGTMSFLVYVYWCLRNEKIKGKFSYQELINIRRFAGGLFLIAVLSVALTQYDKILLSSRLSLEAYGAYSIAVTISGLLFVLIGPITQAYYPRYCQLIQKDNHEELIRQFHNGSQLISLLVGSIAIILMFNSKIILEIWTGNIELAEKAAPIVCAITIGNLINGFMQIPYQMQLAHGWTGLTVRVNSIAIFISIPLTSYLIEIYGEEGGAWGWALINLLLIIINMSIMYSKILIDQGWVWLYRDIIIPMFIGCTFASVFRYIYNEYNINNIYMNIIYIIISYILVTTFILIGSRNIRQYSNKFLKNAKN